MSLDPFPQDELEDFQKDQAVRIRGFLGRLADEDELLRNFINDRVAVLRQAQDDDELESEDVALLLDGNYHHVYEVMSKGSKPIRWIIIWIL